MREKILKKLASWHAYHPWRMLLVVALLTVFFAASASQYKVTMQWSDLLPTGDKRTVQFNKIIDEFVSSTSLVVLVQGEEEHIKEFADVLAPRITELRDSSKNASLQEKIDKIQRKIEKLKTKGDEESKIAELQSEINELRSQIDKQMFQRVNYKTPVEFLRNHGLMLVKEEDLKNIKDIFMDPNLDGLIFNINNSMEKEYVGQEESISTREKEDGAFVFLDGIQNLVLTLQKVARGEEVSEKAVRTVADRLLLGEPYFMSYDKKALILNAIPNFSIVDQYLLVDATDTVAGIVDALLQDYPDVEAGLTGTIAVERDENVYVNKSLGYTTVIALVSILILLMLSFRMWIAPVLAVSNLMLGLVWALGAALLAVGQLNLMTVMMAVILLGLGVDFSIHMISGFTEWRSAGDNISRSLEKTFLKSGKGILTGGVTTAFAFLALIICRSRGLKEMGIVTGIGLLAILLATFLFLPVLLVFRERRVDRKIDRGAKKFVRRDIRFRLLGHTCQWLGKHYVFTIIFSVLISAFMVWSALKITFDHNYMNMEPKGLTSIALQDVIMEKFDLSMDYAMVLTDDVEESRNLSEEFRDLGSVAITEDISVFLPSPEQQQKRIPHLLEIRQSIQSAPLKPDVLPESLPSLRQEIERLEMNIIEMQDMAYLGGHDKVDNKCMEIVGNPDNPDSRNIIQELLELMNTDVPVLTAGLSQFQQHFAPHFQASVVKMCSVEPVNLEDLPDNILDRYSNRTRDQFLITILPAGHIWQDAKFLDRFVEDLDRVSDKATGMPPVFLALIRIIGQDGQNAALLTLGVVFLLLCVDFLSPRKALMAMIPLALGMFWMVGLMHLTGMQLTIMNVMALPIIIGIGIDDGVHIIHRWKHEGKGRVQTVFSSTGKAIFLTSLTTMLAFGSLIFSVFRGFGHLGGAMFLGVGACFLTTVIILPGLIGLIERKKIKDKK